MKCAVSLKEKTRIKQEATKQAVKFMLIAFALYLGDKRGWTRDSICKAIKWIEKYAVMINEDLTTYKEAEEALLEDYGIIITDNGEIRKNG